MLFMCAGKSRPGLSAEDRQKVLKLFGSWQPPAGMEIKGHYVSANGGDYVIVETAAVETLIEATAMWAPFVEYEVTPIVAVQDGIGRLVSAEATRSALL